MGGGAVAASTCNVIWSLIALVVKFLTGEITQFTPAGDQVPTLPDPALRLKADTALAKNPPPLLPSPTVAVLSKFNVNEYEKVSPTTIDAPTALVALAVPDTTKVFAAWAGVADSINPTVAATTVKASRDIRLLDRPISIDRTGELVG